MRGSFVVDIKVLTISKREVQLLIDGKNYILEVGDNVELTVKIG